MSANAVIRARPPDIGDAAEDEQVQSPFAGYLDLVAMVERLHRLLLDVVKDEFERRGKLDVNSVQALLLFNIGDDEVTAGELKTRGYYQGSNVSYNLKKLVEGGYMHHQRCQVDRRAVRISLTDKGREVHGIVSDLFEKQSRAVFSDEERDARLGEVNDGLRRVERFWREQIRYIY